MEILGIDEAGRGPVIGPMVMAGCLVDEKQAKILKEADVRDSKLIAPKKREALFDFVKNNCLAYEIIILTPDEIDSREKRNISLNEIEANASAEIIATVYDKHGKAFKSMLDSPSNNPKAYTSVVMMKVRNLYCDFKGEVVSEIKADLNHVQVAAASILAKVTRDKLIEDMKEKAVKYVNDKELGSGYPSDPKTKEFIKKYWDKFDDFKGGFFRKSWSTWKVFGDKKKQKTFDNFIKK